MASSHARSTASIITCLARSDNLAQCPHEPLVGIVQCLASLGWSRKMTLSAREFKQSGDRFMEHADVVVVGAGSIGAMTL